MTKDANYHVLRDLRQAVEGEEVVYHATLIASNGGREHVTVANGHPAFADVEELYFTYGEQEVGLVEFAVSLIGSNESLASGSFPANAVMPVSY